MRRRAEPGFTLIELVLALSILAVMITILFGGMRVGLRAWQRGEDRAAALQHTRSMTRLVEQALAGTYVYVGQIDQNNPDRPVLFQGQAEKVSFVTVLPPVPISAPIAFVAVTLSVNPGTDGGAPGLAIREKPMPNFAPFEEVPPSVVDPSITALRFRYLRDDGSWEDTWDGVEEKVVPRAVEVTVTGMVNGRVQEQRPITVPIKVNAP